MFVSLRILLLKQFVFCYKSEFSKIVFYWDNKSFRKRAPAFSKISWVLSCFPVSVHYRHHRWHLHSALSSVSALYIVYQRNGDGEAKSPACRAGVREAVLHTLKQGTRLSPQVRIPNVMWRSGGKHNSIGVDVFFLTLLILGSMEEILLMFMEVSTRVGSWQKLCMGKRYVLLSETN